MNRENLENLAEVKEKDEICGGRMLQVYSKFRNSESETFLAHGRYLKEGAKSAW